ncbi:MAG: hypothetical protein WC607_02700 [Candidatus Micrarchaeia archaeon]
MANLEGLMRKHQRNLEELETFGIKKEQINNPGFVIIPGSSGVPVEKWHTLADLVMDEPFHAPLGTPPALLVSHEIPEFNWKKMISVLSTREDLRAGIQAAIDTKKSALGNRAIRVMSPEETARRNSPTRLVIEKCRR